MPKDKNERELDKFLTEQGFKVEGDGVSELPQEVPNEEAAPENSAPQPEGEQQVQEATPENAPPPKPDDPKHNWEKREQDAKAAQRLLSEERSKLALEKRALEESREKAQKDREELEALLREIRAAREETPQPKPQSQVNEPEDEDDADIKQFVDEYPDLAKVVEKLSKRSAKRVAKPLLEKQAELDELRRQVRESQTKSEEDTLREKQERLFMTILEEHPDAFDLVNTPDFKQWISKQPPVFSDIIDNTTNYTADDAIGILNLYRSHKPLPARPSEGDMGVAVRKTTPPVNVGNDNDIFTDLEMENLSLVANNYRTPEQRRKFDEKLARTLNQT